MLLTSHAHAGALEHCARRSTAAARFADWWRGRPVVGGLLIVLSGVELFFSSQLDLGNIHLQLGIEGAQATILPFVLVVLGVLIVGMPQQRMLYGIIALAIAVYCLVGVNLGGFILGTVLGIVGGVLAVSWMPKPEPGETPAHADR